MTKGEIYNLVVRLTEELKRTEVPQRVTEAMIEGDAYTIDIIFDAFPSYYPFLYDQILEFGEVFNELVGDSASNEKKFEEIMEDCSYVMYNLAETNIFLKLVEASEAGDEKKLLEIINDFRKKNHCLVRTLVDFQSEFNGFRNDGKTGYEGQIFGLETDEENGVFALDTNEIDAMSFYVFAILANVRMSYFFYDEARELFENAIESVTNEPFAGFVANYHPDDWVGECKDYHSIGDLLVDAYIDRFEK